MSPFSKMHYKIKASGPGAALICLGHAQRTYIHDRDSAAMQAYVDENVPSWCKHIRQTHAVNLSEEHVSFVYGHTKTSYSVQLAVDTLGNLKSPVSSIIAVDPSSDASRPVTLISPGYTTESPIVVELNVNNGRWRHVFLNCTSRNRGIGGYINTTRRHILAPNHRPLKLAEDEAEDTNSEVVLTTKKPVKRHRPLGLMPYVHRARLR